MATIIQEELDQARVEADAAYALIDVALANEQILRKEVEEMQQKLDSQQRLIHEMEILTLRNGSFVAEKEEEKVIHEMKPHEEDGEAKVDTQESKPIIEVTEETNMKITESDKEVNENELKSSSFAEVLNVYRKSNSELEIRCKVYEEEIKRMYRVIQTLSHDVNLNTKHHFNHISNMQMIEEKNMNHGDADIIFDDKENIETVIKNTVARFDGSSSMLDQRIKYLSPANLNKNKNEINSSITETAMKVSLGKWSQEYPQNGVTASLTTSDTELSYESRDASPCTTRSDLDLRMKYIEEDLSLRSSYFESSSSISGNDSSYDSEDSDSGSGSSSDESSVSMSVAESSVSASTVESSPEAPEASLIDSLSDSDESVGSISDCESSK